MITKVSEVMTRDVEVIQSTATIREAAKEMQQHNVGALPVYAGHTLAGMVTDRDITVKAVAEGIDPTTGRVEEVMTWKVEWVPEETDIQSAARIMEKKALRRLAVLDRDGKLTGIISLSDIATKTHDQRIVEQLVEATASRSWMNPLDGPWETDEQF